MGEKELLAYTEKQAAALLGVSRMTLLRERQAGRLGFNRARGKILYQPHHLERYLELTAHEVPGRANE